MVVNNNIIITKKILTNEKRIKNETRNFSKKIKYIKDVSC